MRGKVVGIVGLGQVGRATARRAAALGCRVLAYDPIPAACVAAPEGVRAAPLEEVIAESHFLSLHLPLTEQTRLLVDEAWLALMRPGAYLVNTARGELLDEAAVLKALQDGRLAGVALDALTQEPPPDDHPFLRRSDVILSGHGGTHTHDAAAAMGRAALSDVLAVLSGQTPRYPVSMPAAG